MKWFTHICLILFSFFVYTTAFSQLSPDMYGIGVKIDTSMVIQSCLDGGPAHHVGLLKGDMILELDSQSVKGWTLSEFRSYLLIEKPLPVKITILRDSVQISYVVIRASMSDMFARENIKIDPDSRWGVTRLHKFDSLSIGSIAFPLKLTDLECNEVKLDNYPASHTVLYFWANWCPPCKFLIKKIIENEEKISNAGINIIGINLDDHCEIFQDVTASLKPLGKQYWGGNYFGKVSQLFCVYRRGIPSAALIDSEGRLVEESTGANRIITMIEKTIKSQ